MKTEAIVYVTLAPGVCAEVRVRVIEEPLPTPLELPRIREPGVTEMDAVAGLLSAKSYCITPPFPIPTASWPKPRHHA
jgi:hypothetical protein